MSKTKTKAAEPIKPIRPPRKSEQSLRVVFTEKELLEIGKKLAESNRDLEAAENEKKSVTATLKAKCDSVASRIQQYAGELTNGYTYRSVACETRFDCPKKGMKTTVRLDSGETVSVDAMSLGEMQADLELVESDKSSPDRAPLRSVSGDGVVVTDEDEEFLGAAAR